MLANVLFLSFFKSNLTQWHNRVFVMILIFYRNRFFCFCFGVQNSFVVARMHRIEKGRRIESNLARRQFLLCFKNNNNNNLLMNHLYLSFNYYYNKWGFFFCCLKQKFKQIKFISWIYFSAKLKQKKTVKFKMISNFLLFFRTS